MIFTKNIEKYICFMELMISILVETGHGFVDMMGTSRTNRTTGTHCDIVRVSRHCMILVNKVH